MSAYKKLLKNSGIFAIANLGSKIITILLVPYYTYVLSTTEYGTIDLINTTISLIFPIITLSIFDATLRFSVKSEYTSCLIINSSLTIAIVGNLIFFMLYPMLSKVAVLKEIINLFYLIIFLQSINCVVSQFSRGIGKVKQFAVSGVLNTLVLVISNIILLSCLGMGIEGYLISTILGYLISTTYLIISVRLWKYITIKQINLNIIKEMIAYSLPLIPNTLMWWIMNASDRYVITCFIGMAANGIYAIAYKIPTILNLLYSIFSQAWQLSAIEEGDSQNKSEFYTNVFEVLSIVMIIITSGIVLFVRPLIETILENDYQESWRYVPFLLLAVVFTSFSSFLGTNYIAMKETKGVFKTSLIGAILNMFLNVILIPIIGLNGASISTMISFLIVWIIRIFDTKKFVQIRFNIKSLVFSFLIIMIQIIFYYSNYKYYFIVQGGLLVLLILVNARLLLKIGSQLMMFVRRNKIR